MSAAWGVTRGLGGGVTLDAWQRIALAFDRPLRLELGRDANEEPADAGHLSIQELILRSGRRCGYARTFEMPTRPADPARSADDALRRENPRRIVLVECWNGFGDFGSSARSFDRKMVEADQMAAATWGAEAYRVAGCWVVRASARNRALVARYQEIFEGRFPGSSTLWVRALTEVRSLPPSRVSSGATSGLPACSPGVAAPDESFAGGGRAVSHARP